MDVKIICRNLVFMDVINHFCIIGDVTGYINMHNPYLFNFGNKKLQYMSSTTKLQLKKINEQNHNIALGAKKIVQNEDSTWEYENILQHPNITFLEDKKSWAGRTIMPPFL